MEEYKEVYMEDPSINPFQVIKNFCSYEGTISFNVNESEAEQDPLELVAGMIVGDGDEKKGSRTAIFHPLFRDFACSIVRKGSKIIINTVYAESVSEPSATDKAQTQGQSQGGSQGGSKADKYK
jgi:hypothetical protein